MKWDVGCKNTRSRRHHRITKRRGRKPKRDKDAKSQAFGYLQFENSLHSLFLWPQNCTCQLRADPAESTKKEKEKKSTDSNSNSQPHLKCC